MNSGQSKRENQEEETMTKFVLVTHNIVVISVKLRALVVSEQVACGHCVWTLRAYVLVVLLLSLCDQFNTRVKYLPITPLKFLSLALNCTFTYESNILSVILTCNVSEWKRSAHAIHNNVEIPSRSALSSLLSKVPLRSLSYLSNFAFTSRFCCSVRSFSVITFCGWVTGMPRPGSWNYRVNWSRVMNKQRYRTIAAILRELYVGCGVFALFVGWCLFKWRVQVGNCTHFCYF